MNAARIQVIFFSVLMMFVANRAAFAEETEAATSASSWQNESELGITVASGNASAETYQVKQTTRYLWGMNVARLSGHYLYGLAAGREAARNWDASARYERLLGDRFGAFVGNSWEGDPFIGFDYRSSVDTGIRYYLIPGDKKVDFVATELGYRFMYEDRVAGIVPPSLTSHMIRAYAEGVGALLENLVGRVSVEILPDLAQTDNLQINFEASVSASISTNLSLKLGYQGKFRNLTLGVGRKKYDSLITSALIARF